MKLVVIHNHFRPGGVRRVIELATPVLAHGLEPRVREVVVVTGELPETGWAREFEQALAPQAVSWRADPSLLYVAEQRGPARSVRSRLRQLLLAWLGPEGATACVWAHNQGLGRNLLLTRELQRACLALRIPLVMHHHDWWFDNRWDRWREMRRQRLSLNEVASIILCSDPGIRHVAINQADAVILNEYLAGVSTWIPNPVQAGTAQAPRGAENRSRQWLRSRFDVDAPVWLMPGRLLRRKNIAEALLLTRWLRPQAWLVTTGDVSSKEEQAYAERLGRAAREQRWRLRLGVLGAQTPEQPSVPEMMAASEAILLTSIQEGFGLPYLEAAQARRPLLARALPNVMPDLEKFGFRFPQQYREILVSPELFNWRSELKRQEKLFQRWVRSLPRAFRQLTTGPLFMRGGQPEEVPFSRLTLTAQLEVLSAPLQQSWELCAGLNAFLKPWRDLAEAKAFRVTPWPERASRWLSGPAFLKRFRRLLAARNRGARTDVSVSAQEAFVRSKLAADNLYPLSWAPET